MVREVMCMVTDRVQWSSNDLDYTLIQLVLNSRVVFSKELWRLPKSSEETQQALAAKFTMVWEWWVTFLPW